MCLSDDGRIRIAAQAPNKESEAQAVDKKPLDCSGRWALDGRPSTLLETELAQAQRKNLGILIQGRQVEIDQTETELKISRGTSIVKIFHGTAPRRDFLSTASSLFQWPLSIPTRSPSAIKPVNNSKIKTTQELTISGGLLVVETTPPLMGASGVPPKSASTAVLTVQEAVGPPLDSRAERPGWRSLTDAPQWRLPRWPLFAVEFTW